METIKVSVDAALKEKVTGLYARLGLTVEDAIRLFLRRSVQERGLPFPMRGAMIEADEEVRKFLATRQGLPVYKTPQEAFETLDRL
ncbi:MAG: type II toxin-antitoxin system RelB/DinJ family antitoxin [Duodenibacillus sp.]|nr:type II toxin-antitoxin system RelB/DinJ family antitoxin [Duodenibacillus sp.]